MNKYLFLVLAIIFEYMIIALHESHVLKEYLVSQDTDVTFVIFLYLLSLLHIDIFRDEIEKDIEAK